MGSIYLIRHGQASFGADNYDVLSPLGHRQAEMLGDHMGQLGVSFDRCVSGELNRQIDTGNTAIGRIEHLSSGAQPAIEVDTAFNEFLAGEVIRAHLPELIEVEPDAMRIFSNATSQRAEFQRLFSYVIRRWISGEHEKDGLE